MVNIYVESKGPKGVQMKESLTPTVVAGSLRGLCVTYGADATKFALVAAAAVAAIGVLEEDALSLVNPSSVIEFGQTVAQIGADITKGSPLATDANGRLVPATPGQAVVAIALEDQTYVAPNSFGATSFACVFVLGPMSYVAQGSAARHATVAGAIAVQTGTVGLGSGAALAMTLATPTNAQDGTRITVTAETAHAHTVTAAANKINGSKDTVTFAAVGDSVTLEALGGLWMAVSLIGATLSEV